MASWIVHIRICDGLIDSLRNIDAELFAVGNIGADCGVWINDGFSPPQTVTHFSHTGKKRDIRCEEYFDTFVSGGSGDDLPFYLGYYIHLLTDIMWVEEILSPDYVRYAERLASNPQFIQEIKRDWYDLDKLFLREHPDFRSFRLLRGAHVDKPYHDFSTAELINSKIAEIIDFYKPTQENLDRNYPFLSKDRMDAFVEKAVKIITRILTEKSIIS